MVGVHRNETDDRLRRRSDTALSSSATIRHSSVCSACLASLLTSRLARVSSIIETDSFGPRPDFSNHLSLRIHFIVILSILSPRHTPAALHYGEPKDLRFPGRTAPASPGTMPALLPELRRPLGAQAMAPAYRYPD